MIVAGGAVFLKEKITILEKLGVGVAFAGSIVTLAQPLLERGAAGEKAAFGNLLVLLYHISWATYALWNKRVSKKFNFSSLTMTAVPIFISVPIFALLAYLESSPHPPLADPISNFQLLTSIPGILYMSIISYLVAYYLYDWSVKRIEASAAAVYGYLQPIFAFPAAYLLLGETPTPYFLLGAALIGVGVFITEY
jgi:drug/metabolite transporter (DMT)-like permease